MLLIPYSIHQVTYQEIDEEDGHNYDENDPDEVGNLREWKCVPLFIALIAEPEDGAIWASSSHHHQVDEGQHRIEKRRGLQCQKVTIMYTVYYTSTAYACLQID